MKRTLLSFAIAALLLPAAAMAGEETTSSAREAGQLGPQRPDRGGVVVRPGPYEPRPVHRPPPRPPVVIHRPPPVIFYPAPSPRLGWTCDTGRNECELSRPKPLGDDCSCRTPWGTRKWGVVRP